MSQEAFLPLKRDGVWHNTAQHKANVALSGYLWFRVWSRPLSCLCFHLDILLLKW